MKYILTIDTETKKVSPSLARPMLLRTGAESPTELMRRQEIFRTYQNATLPHWLYDEAASLEAKL